MDIEASTSSRSNAGEHFQSKTLKKARAPAHKYIEQEKTILQSLAYHTQLSNETTIDSILFDLQNIDSKYWNHTTVDNIGIAILNKSKKISILCSEICFRPPICM